MQMCCCDHIRDCTRVQKDGIYLHYLFKKFLEQPGIMHNLWGKHANCQDVSLTSSHFYTLEKLSMMTNTQTENCRTECLS